MNLGSLNFYKRIHILMVIWKINIFEQVKIWKLGTKKITFIVLIKMPQNEKRSYSGFRLLLPSYVHQAWFLLKLLMKFSCKLCIMLRKNERDKKIASSCQKSLLNKCTTSNYTKRIMSSSAFVNFRNYRNWKKYCHNQNQK